MKRYRDDHRIAWVSALLVLLAPAVCLAQDKGRAEPPRHKYRGILGLDSKKIKQDRGKTLLWAGGGKGPDSPDAQWYDFTGASIPPAELQFGIGKDRIRAIDDPLFVSAHDPRLLKVPPSPYRPNEKPDTNDDIMVFGFVDGDEVRAYPLALLDRHELVNDSLGGTPVIAGW